MVFIDNQEKLNNFISKACASRVLCIDTEFMRERTYRPQLCLMQFQIEDESFVLDPFCFDTLKPLAEVMNCDTLVKVFHAADQDIEIIYQETGAVPHPVFDTQIASSVIDGKNCPGLSTLLECSLDVKIPKSEGFTDWAQRPLTEKQISYSIDDVLYLPALYDYQNKKMAELGREHWLDDEFAALENVSKYKPNPRERYIHLKHVTKLKPKKLALAREVAAWREEVAIRKNIPRKWVMTDEQIIEICKRDPRNIDSLFAVRGVHNTLSTNQAREVLAALKRGRECKPEDLPRLDTPSANLPHVDEVLQLMNAILYLRARENSISPQVIASNNDLVNLARGMKKNSPLMSGWRYQVVGAELKELLDGKISLTVKNGGISVQQKD